MSPPTEDAGVLASKRAATAYRILVEIAQRQPAVNQQEIADAVGVTAQAVSDYLGDLNERGFVDKQGRGRYAVTKEGVDWLITETEALREFAAFVAGDVIEEVGVETAIAAADIEEGQRVSLMMRDGVLHADPTGNTGATAVAVTDARAGRDVGVTNFEGVIDYELGTVTILVVPPVREGGSGAVDTALLDDIITTHDLVAVDTPEGLALARESGVSPDIQFGTVAAVRDAATKGLDVLVLATRNTASAHTETLREHGITYERRDDVCITNNNR